MKNLIFSSCILLVILIQNSGVIQVDATTVTLCNTACINAGIAAGRAAIIQLTAVGGTVEHTLELFSVKGAGGVAENTTSSKRAVEFSGGSSSSGSKKRGVEYLSSSTRDMIDTSGTKLKYSYGLSQTSSGVPLWKSTYVYYIDLITGAITSTTNLWVTPNGFSSTPLNTAISATTAAINSYCPSGCTYTVLSTTLYAVNYAPAISLAWKVTFTPNGALGPWVYFVNDSNFAILDSWNTIHSGNAIGISLYDGQVGFNSSQVGATYYMEDLTASRRTTVLDCQGGNCSTNYRVSDSDNYWNASSQANAVSVHWAASKALDYMSYVLGRWNIDDSNLTTLASTLVDSTDGSTTLFPHYVNYGAPATNYTPSGSAYYTPSGIFYSTAVTSIDMVGHEMFHGVLLTGSNASLNYPVGQPGALQEAYCDIFGNMVERYILGESNSTWRFGEDFYTPTISGDAVRCLDYPHNSANISGVTTSGNPDYYTQLYGGTVDNSGIHVNIGIPEKAFYLLAKGGQHELGGPILSGIGTDAAAMIWYTALYYSTPFTDFTTQKTNLLRAARDIYGCTNCLQYVETSNSWAAVGVGSVLNLTTNITATNFETDELPWYLIGGSAVFYINGNGSFGSGHSGSRGYVQLGGFVGYSGTLWSGPWNISSISTAATLSFWLSVISSDTTNPGPDTLTVTIQDAVTQVVLTQLVTFTNLYTPKNTWQQHTYFNLQAYSSHTLVISFAVNNDATSPTEFLVDDILFAQAQA
jgi:Zn-dependent metalloprotease